MSDFNSNSGQQNFLNEEPKEEGLGVGLTILAFCIPLAGIILYFVNKDKAPKKAQTACYAALAGAALGIVVRVLTMATGRY